jgi:hypothetical protein
VVIGNIQTFYLLRLCDKRPRNCSKKDCYNVPSIKRPKT